MINLFIDTNIFLSSFNPDGSGLSNLNHILKLIKDKRIILYITPQLIDEHDRNQKEISNLCLTSLNTKFTRTLTIDKNLYLKGGNPEWTKNLKEIRVFHQNNKKQYSKNIKFIKKIRILIGKIFKISKLIKESDNIINKAHIRYLKGNPPIKRDQANGHTVWDGSFGDAIHWESLLEVVEGDLHIVCNDPDFLQIENSIVKIDQFLEKEWIKNKHSKVFAYRHLSDFLSDVFKIKEVKKDISDEDNRILDRNEYRSDVVQQSLSWIDGMKINIANPFSMQNHDPFVIDANNIPSAVYRNPIIFRDFPRYCTYCGGVASEYNDKFEISSHRLECSRCKRIFYIK